MRNPVAASFVIGALVFTALFGVVLTVLAWLSRAIRLPEETP